MSKILKSFSLLILLTAFGLFTTLPAQAQCPMCKAAVEGSMKDKSSNKGKGLNLGILYLLSMPYLAVGVVGTVWFMRSKRKKSTLV
jgi:hypothetical protein